VILLVTLVSSMKTSRLGSSLALPPSQGLAIGRDVRPIRLGGVQAFF
jgi:hypothetical protein